MNRANFWRVSVVLAVATAIFAAGRTVVAAPKQPAPFAVVLADDDDTRGDWIGTYGTHGYVLCGMRSPYDLSGGAGWPPLSYSVATGDPEETARAWRSSAPTERDRSVLLEPSGLKRTAASWDDHGEVYPLGQGPDLHVQISIPDGPFLLSLYFFEIDWIQHRAYRIRVFADNLHGEPLAETEANNFFKGKKR